MCEYMCICLLSPPRLPSFASQQWHPAKYLAFERLRLRPALELLNRVPSLPAEKNPGEAIRIVDLGAGTGNIAPAFIQRWPRAQIAFVDSSMAMLERGKADHVANPEVDEIRFSYVEATFDSFTPSEPVDLIYSNAALQWVNSDVHKTLFPRLFSFLKPGGVLASQIPDTRAQPSHQLIVETAKQLGWEKEVANDLIGESTQENLHMWATVYAQIMEDEAPWQTSRLRRFEAKYRQLIAAAYAKQSDGRTISNFKRFFLVAAKPADAQ